jgi:orotate phosphoribosyltransferase
VARAVTDLAVRAVAELGRERFDVIAGAETAGIAFAAWLAERLDCELRYVRKRPLGIGRNAQVEGGSVEGRRVLLFDDLATDAGSKVAFVRGLREAGAVVSDALVIFSNGVFPGVVERLDALGLSMHAMAAWPDMLATGLLSRPDQAVIEAFLSDPIAWSTKHGGRTAR